eukprot:TRINITY_DN24270_c0_g1_i1.p1 TRINITY_DN24270_c0_g1~~TRINITY_DN24270_c0_g1_i1.p1  ORF type:complete len:157 (-),score=18.64 TRINITY_DN24270_c0_g1_i1:285-728(-)
MPHEQVRRSVACEQRFRLTKMCTFHAAGKCKRGSKCTFAHAPQDLLPQLDLKKTSLCRFFVEQGFCRNGNACGFAHSYHELRGNVSEHDPSAGGHDAFSVHRQAFKPSSELDDVDVQHEAVTTQSLPEAAVQRWLNKAASNTCLLQI